RGRGRAHRCRFAAPQSPQPSGAGPVAGQAVRPVRGCLHRRLHGRASRRRPRARATGDARQGIDDGRDGRRRHGHDPRHHAHRHAGRRRRWTPSLGVHGMSPRATGTASQAAVERMDAARALWAHPLLTAAHPEELALVRLHAPALRGTFKTVLGYSLIVESTFARLVKGPVSADGPARPARRPDSSTFTPVIYTHLALLCAALLAPGTG